MEKLTIIKVGGKIVEEADTLAQLLTDFAQIPGLKILVHGGGVMASSLQKRLGIEPVMIAGRRVTDARTLEIVTMVYAGWCNKHVTATLQKYGCNALGLCGADGKAILAARRPPVKVPPVKVALTGEAEIREVDYGFAGDISPEGVNVPLFESFLNRKIMPVLCAITYDGNGNLLNTNADSVASAVAEALAGAGHETVLTYCFEKKGVLEDKNDPDSVIPEITPEYYETLKSEGRVADGMIPKLDNAFKALANGVSKVVIRSATDLGNPTGTSIIMSAGNNITDRTAGHSGSDPE